MQPDILQRLSVTLDSNLSNHGMAGKPCLPYLWK